MRQIKFRAKIKSTDPIISKRWVYGYYCKVEGKHYIIPDDAEITESVNYESAITGFLEVDPETVEQYIGDKDGKEIYDKNLIMCVYLLDKFPYIVKYYENKDLKC